MIAPTFALVALMPAMLGPLPETEQVLVVKLCADGGIAQLAIPIGNDEPDRPDPCHSKGCHAASSRKSLIERKDA